MHVNVTVEDLNGEEIGLEYDCDVMRDTLEHVGTRHTNIQHRSNGGVVTSRQHLTIVTELLHTTAIAKVMLK